MKGLGLCVWRTKNVSIGGKNVTDIQYASIGDHVKFIDTVKCYQQSQANLVENCDEDERENIKKSLLHFLQNHPKYRTKFEKLTENEKNGLSNILALARELFHMKKIKGWSDLDSHPKGEFFTKTEFLARSKIA